MKNKTGKINAITSAGTTVHTSQFYNLGSINHKKYCVFTYLLVVLCTYVLVVRSPPKTNDCMITMIVAFSAIDLITLRKGRHSRNIF